MNRPIRCRLCGQPTTKEPARVCICCGKPIRRGHKFIITRKGLHHRQCRWPTAGVTPAEYRANHGERTYRDMAPLIFGKDYPR